MSWTPTVSESAPWGHLRVTIGGHDVTWFRGVETQVGSWEHTDPYGPSSASLTLPQVTVFDDRDHDPALKKWLYEGAVIRMDQVRDGKVISKHWPPFHGIIDSIEESEAGTAISCSGHFNGRLSAVCHQPPVWHAKGVDGGRVIWRELANRAHFRILPYKGLVTGIKIEANGSRDMTRLGWIDECLSMLVKQDGSSVTVLPDTRAGSTLRDYRMQWRELKSDPDATVDAGAHGVTVTLRRDLLDMPTAVYGEGVAPGGERWRNRRSPNLDDKTPMPPYPFRDHRSFGQGTKDEDTDTGDGIYLMNRELLTDGVLSGPDLRFHEFTEDTEDAVEETQRHLRRTVTGRMTYSLWQDLYKKTSDVKSRRGSYFAPLAIDERTRYTDKAPDGTPIGINDSYDGRIVKVHEFVNYGEGVRKKDARRNARAILARAAAKNGTVTLTTDPAEMSRLDLRPGMTLKLRHYHGEGVRLYISQVSVDWGSDTHPVSLEVSTTPKHYLDLATIKERNRAARKSPAKKAHHLHRRSSQVSDAVGGWEGESGAGFMRPKKLGGQHWNVFQVSAAERGVMREITYDVDPNTSFYLAVFAASVTQLQLHHHVGNPSEWVGSGKNRESVWQAHNDWLVEDGQRLVEAWGNPWNPCGYYPHHHHSDGEFTDHPVTGRLRDYAAWDFHSPRGSLWVAVWPERDCTGSGRMKIQINEGA